MSEILTCFACDNEPTRQCSRCGRPYCDDHGEELCDACLEPASGVPSFSLYRGSLLALLIGTALAVWLLVQPTTSEGDGLRPVILTPTSTTARTDTTPGPQQTPGPGAATTPGAQTTPGAPVATTPPAGTTPAAGGNTYTVAAGDTLSAICAARRPNLPSTDCVEQVQTLNGITSSDISVGQVLRLP
ncbi:MAG: LysM peptidoglycan-binding domain-containing protein [Dehalococcoidia bacterium]|nr:LysM peptidoglycan-binding domain-containing protein [Dehalococcoidia bacterium]